MASYSKRAKKLATELQSYGIEVVLNRQVVVGESKYLAPIFIPQYKLIVDVFDLSKWTEYGKQAYLNRRPNLKRHGFTLLCFTSVADAQTPEAVKKVLLKISELEPVSDSTYKELTRSLDHKFDELTV